MFKELARDRSCARTSDELSTPIDRTVSEELSELEQALARQLDSKALFDHLFLPVWCLILLLCVQES